MLFPLQMPLSRYSEFQEAFGAATERRKTGSTNINATSSRSHAILEITCWDFDFKHQLGKLRLLDLAGTVGRQYPLLLHLLYHQTLHTQA